ncbi:glycosyltransferase [Lapidilactobacillus bayanensis]|uniref:glycosyltransferase n=1 Tax=Lapidilactobacillus bayanensis TaxID=2485998 RepID=UPI000F77F855|nr:glycosyltransferase [Lapidilactobacillus bayanensis]
MKLVFAHDHKLRNINGRYYTTGGLSNEIISKYLDFFDSVTIFCRVIEKQDSDTSLSELTNSRVTIKPTSFDGSLIPKSSILKQMEHEISTADGLIVKLHSVVAEFAIHYARKHHIPYLIECVGDPWDAYWNYNIKGKMIAPFMTLLTKSALKKAPYVMYVTKEYLEKRYPTNGRWIACSDVVLKKANTDVLEQRLSRIRNNRMVFKLGTLAQVDVRYKGQEYVIEALAGLKKRGLKIEYELVGSGNSNRLRQIAEKFGVEDQVNFLGTIDHSDIFDWLDTIDLYIQPSKQEGLPRSLAEALSRACPAIGADVGGISELISKDCIFPKGNVKEIAQLIASADKKFLIKNAKENYNNAQNYDVELLSEKRRKFYEEFSQICAN